MESPAIPEFRSHMPIETLNRLKYGVLLIVLGVAAGFSTSVGVLWIIYSNGKLAEENKAALRRSQAALEASQKEIVITQQKILQAVEEHQKTVQTLIHEDEKTANFSKGTKQIFDSQQQRLQQQVDDIKQQLSKEKQQAK